MEKEMKSLSDDEMDMVSGGLENSRYTEEEIKEMLNSSNPNNGQN